MKRLAISLVLLLAATQAAAQDYTALTPLVRTYSLLGFSFQSPKGDGWREVGSAPDAVQLVYAEQLTPDTINTRLAFEGHAFVILDQSKAPDAATLAQLSMSQRLREAKDAGQELVAMSKIAPVQADVPVFEYTIVLKLDQKDRFLNYFVAMAPDKTQYFAAKLETEDLNFRDQPYYAPLRESIGTLKFTPAAKPQSGESGKQDSPSSPDADK